MRTARIERCMGLLRFTTNEYATEVALMCSKKFVRLFAVYRRHMS